MSSGRARGKKPRRGRHEARKFSDVTDLSRHAAPWGGVSRSIFPYGRQAAVLRVPFGGLPTMRPSGSRIGKHCGVTEESILLRRCIPSDWAGTNASVHLSYRRDRVVSQPFFLAEEALQNAKLDEVHPLLRSRCLRD